MMKDGVIGMEKTLLRVLHVVGGMDAGGVETLLMTVYRLIDRERVQFDFLCPDSGRQFFYEDEIHALGGVVYRVRQSHKEPFATRRRLGDFFRTHRYEIVHVHVPTLGYLVGLKQAARAGVPTRVLHAHNTHMLVNSPRALFEYVCHILNRRFGVSKATDVFLCSGDAAVWFGLKFDCDEWKLVRNGTDTARFRFDVAKRREMRRELAVDDNEFLVGHVGRYCSTKNQLFLLEAFAKLLKRRPESKLVLVGSGELEGEIRRYINECEISERVMLLHNRSDIDRLQCALDVFCFPSTHEGLGIAMVEAEASGITCLVSDRIPHDGILTDHVKTLSISDGVDEWVDALACVRVGVRFPADADVVKAAGFDISTTAAELQGFYIERAAASVGGEAECL